VTHISMPPNEEKSATSKKRFTRLLAIIDNLGMSLYPYQVRPWCRSCLAVDLHLKNPMPSCL
jgi:hypothetical protein